MARRRAITDHFRVKKTDVTCSKNHAVQQQPTLELEALKQFDLDWKFGPCAGITRQERWDRANKLGLDPPKHIFDILARHSNDMEYTQNLWHDMEI